jgi:HlyD family secretion protein
MKSHLVILVTALLLSTILSCRGGSDEVLYSGMIELDDYDLMAPFTAELLTLMVEEGDSVFAGDTVAVLDTTIIGAKRAAARAAVERARANLADLEAGSDTERIAAARSRLESAEATLSQTERDLTRINSLHEQNLTDDRTLEQATLSAKTARANRDVALEELSLLERGARSQELQSAGAVLSQTKSEFVVLDRQVEDAFLVAKTNGIIHLIPFDIGEMIPSGRSVVTIHNRELLWITIYVPEADLGRVAVGNTVQFSVDAYPDSSFSAAVVHISSSAEFTPRNVQTQDERLNLVFAVKLKVTSGIGQLRAGMPADVQL